MQKIAPGEGVGQLRFGLTESEVRELLGQPDRRDRVGGDDGEWIEWHYDSLGLSLYFDRDADCCLVTIDINNPEVELDGFKPIGIDEDSALEILGGMGEITLEDEYPEHGRRVYDLVGTEVWFWFEDGLCDSVQVSAFLDDDGDYMWP
jgi:hypothetical protein